MKDNLQVRLCAIDKALDYYSRQYRHIDFQQLHTQHGGYANKGEAPTTEQIIATAEKFLGFMLTAKGAQQPRAKR